MKFQTRQNNQISLNTRMFDLFNTIYTPKILLCDFFFFFLGNEILLICFFVLVFIRHVNGVKCELDSLDINPNPLSLFIPKLKPRVLWV